MAVKITQKYELFKDVDGDPLENGYIYIGTTGLNPETSLITVYFDEALTLPASQPLRTSGGYIQNAGTPANIYTDSDYSITVRNKNETLIYTSLSNNAEVGLTSSVDTIGDLIGLDEATTTEELEVYGYYAKGDGVGGLFIWDSTANKPDANGGTIIDPSVSLANQGTGIGTGCWMRQYSGAINIKWFGAKPDYSAGSGTNNSGYLQAAIDYIETGNIGGGEIFIPKGDYFFTDTVTIDFGGVAIIGESRRSTRLFIKTTGTSFIDVPLPSPDTAGSTYFAFKMSNMRIQGYGTDGLGAGCGNGISIADANDVLLEYMTVTNFSESTACYMRSGAFNNVIEQCEFSNSKHCLDINGVTGTPNKVTMVMLNNVVCSGAIEGNSLLLNQCVVVTCNSCTIQDATLDIGATSITGQGARVIDCETIIFNDCWMERTENANIFAERVENLIVNKGHYTSAGYTGGAVGTEDGAYPSFDLKTVKKSDINKPFFYERNGNHIKIDSACEQINMWLIPSRDNTANSVSDTSNISHKITTSTSKYVFSNYIFEAKEFRASNINGFALLGGDGSDHQIRVDASKKAYIRRDNDGIVRASGDFHYGGNTGSRPSSPLTYESYFDTQINKPIWWNGSNWIDSTGTTV